MTRRHRKILLITAVASVLALLSTTLGFTLYVRSDGNRRSVEERLSERLGLKLSIGEISPLSLTARRLHDVRAELPDRALEVFRCDEVTWRSESRGAGKNYSLRLNRGRLLVGANEWGRADYGKMLQSGLGHDFSALGLRTINLIDIDLQWKHPRMTFSADRCSGLIRFDNDGAGFASLSTGRLNDVEVATPIQITARFTPGARIRFHEVVLEVSEAPLTALRLDDLVGATVTCGRFSGNVRYQGELDEELISVSGAVYDAFLHELTARLPGGPYRGEVDVVVEEATFGATSLQRLRFHGELTGLNLDRIAADIAPGLDGVLDLRVKQAIYQDGGIKRFEGSGRATGVTLGPLTKMIGRGRATGTLKIVIHELTIVDDRLTHADVSVTAIPPVDEPGEIDRALLESISLRALGYDATIMLPGSVRGVEYKKFGARLILDGEELRIRGSHGLDGKTILTLSLLGSDLGVVREPANPLNVGDLLAAARESLGRYDFDQLRKWLGFADGSPVADQESQSKGNTE